MQLKRPLILAISTAMVLGALVSGELTFAWVRENLSGDFVDQASGKLDIGFTAATFLLWSAIIAASLAIVGAAVLVLRLKSLGRH